MKVLAIVRALVFDNPIVRVLLVACALCLPQRALAFGYQEHHDVVCEAVTTVCTSLLESKEGEGEGHKARRLAVAGMLCNFTQCGNPGNKPVTTYQKQTLFEDGCMTRDFGDAVALIDYESGRTLREMTCGQIEQAKDNLINSGVAALIADDHFCPKAPIAFREDHRIARALAFAASSTMSGPDSSAPDYFSLRMALFQEAQALHYYTDNFAVGHQMARLQDQTDPLVTKSIHDYYNEEGRVFATRDGQRITGFGDGHLDKSPAQRLAMAKAVVSALSEVVMSYVDATLHVTETPEQLVALCPNDKAEPADLVNSVPPFHRHHRGELRVGFQDVIQPPVGGEVLGARIVVADLEYARPILPALNLAFKAEIASWKAGVTLDELNHGVTRRYHARDVAFVPAIEFEPVIWRLIRASLSFAPRVSLVDLFDSKPPGFFHVGGWFDGFDILTGAEFSVLAFAVRPTVILGERRSLHDGLAFAYGSGFSAAYRW